MTLTRRPRFRLLPLLVVAAIFAVFAVPALAEEPSGPPAGPPMAPCAAGQFPTSEKPCALPPCAEGTTPTREKPCAGRPGSGPGGPTGPGGTSDGSPCGPGGGPGGPGPTGGGDKPPTDGPPTAVKSETPRPEGGSGGGCKPPDMARGFMNRVWKFVGEVDSYDDGVLSITVGKILNLPKRYGDEKDEIVDEDARVLISASVRVYDKDGKRANRSDLKDAENVRVQGKMLATSKWKKDEDDQPVPTIRAKKVFILG